MSNYEVLIDTKTLVEALKSMRVGRKFSRNADIFFTGDRSDRSNLVIEIKGIDRKITANGCWHGTIQSQASPFYALIRVPPKEKYVKIIFKDDRMSIGTWSISARDVSNKSV